MKPSFHRCLIWVCYAIPIILLTSPSEAKELLLRVQSDKNSYLTDEAIKITWQVENNEGTPVVFDHTIRDGLTTGYIVEQISPKQETIKHVPVTGHYLGSYAGPYFKELEGGGSYARIFNMQRFLTIPPGRYRLKFYFDTSHTSKWRSSRNLREESAVTLRLESNPIEFEIRDQKTKSLNQLIKHVTEKSGALNLTTTLSQKLPREAAWGDEKQKAEYDNKISALKSLLLYGNRLALPLIELNMSLGINEVDSICCRMLFEFSDIGSSDIRLIVNRRLEGGGFTQPMYGWFHTLLQKGHDIENLPVILKAYDVLPKQEGAPHNLLVTLRIVIFVGAKEKREFFPYEWDDFIELEKKDLLRIQQIWDKRKDEILKASNKELKATR